MKAKEMTTRQLIGECIRLDRERKQVNASLNSYKAELQARGLAEMEDRNVRFVKYYGENGTASVADAMSLDIIAPDKLQAAVGSGIWDTKVKTEVSAKYKCDAKFERMLKAVFMGDYTFEMSLEEFLDEMPMQPDAKQKKLLLRKLKGDFEKDRETLRSVLVPEGEEPPDFDVELWYIYKIKNAELIRLFLPEEGLDGTLEAIRKSIIVDTKTSITIDYDSEKEE